MKKITIITGQHLLFNPRVWKEANTLSHFGYKVSIFTTWYSASHINEDRGLIDNLISYYPSISIVQKHQSKLHILFAKGVKKIANLLYIIFKIDSVYQLIYLPNVQYKNVVKNQADLFICHQEAGLLLGIKLLKAGYKVAFDFEDWYSEDYPNGSRPVLLLKNAEAYALKYGKYITCPSVSMASVLSNVYDKNAKVNVLYNSFPLKNLLTTHVEKIPNSLVWFSQTIGPNRGIESFLMALQKLSTPLNIHFIGNCENKFKDKLFDLLQCSPHTLKIHSLLSHDQLMIFLQHFKIGLALEEENSLSRMHTITNKILCYLQLNLNVIASTTAGQIELKEKFYDRIAYISLDDQKDIINKVTELLDRRIHSMYNLFPEEYSWERQQKKIEILVNKVVEA